MSVECVPPRSIEYLDKRHTKAHFSCGIESLDRYFQQQAMQDIRRKVAAGFVLVDNGGAAVIGYYTLSSTSIDVGELPSEISKKLPRYPRLPATLIGRLAVSQDFRGQRIGEFLLMDALQRSLGTTKEIGSVAVIVDALDDRAREFYLHYDFIQFPDIPNRLFLPMKTIEQMFE